jgi:hypothetical protein
MPNIYLDSSAPRQQPPQLPDGEAAKKFEAVKTQVDSKQESGGANGGPTFRGPQEGGATADPPEGGPAPRGVDGCVASVGGEIVIDDKGRPKFKGVTVGVTCHNNPEKREGYGAGIKDGKPGVAKDNAEGGSVTTLGDVKGGGKSGGNTGAAGPPPLGKDPIPDSLFFYKLTTPPERQINDLGPSTNEPQQKKDDTAVV